MNGKGALAAFVISVILVVAMVATMVVSSDSGAEKGSSIFVYCAAGIRRPVAAAAKEYEKEFGVTVQLQYGGSATLLGQIEILKKGDLYVPADSKFIVVNVKYFCQAVCQKYNYITGRKNNTSCFKVIFFF